VASITLRDLSITRLDAFTWLAETESVVLTELPSLFITRGFHNLTRVSGALSITDSLVGVLDGFRSLVQVGSLTLQRIETLTLAPLAALRVVEDDLLLTDNPSLRVVTGLHGLTLVGGDLVVQNNPALTPEAIRALTEAVDTVGGEVVVE
jgi:hypothetical protein